jgi:hypothetical protein
VTKFGNIPDGGGHRFVGRREGAPQSARNPRTAPRRRPTPTHRHRLPPHRPRRPLPPRLRRDLPR